MEIERFILIFIIAFQLSAKAQAAEVWVSRTDGFGANFPSAPQKVGAESSTVSAYAYQSAKEFSSGIVLYSIAVTPLTSDVKPEDEKTYLAQLNSDFVKTMGQDPRVMHARWSKFGTKINRLNYEFDYDLQGVPLMKTYGYWLVDRGRVLRVSVSYTKTLSDKDRRTTLEFLDSFALIYAD